MSPFQDLYGRLPLSVTLYPLGSSKVAAVDDLLMECDGLLRQLKDNLFSAKRRMEVKANRRRRDIEFNVGDIVLFKLQLYQQIILARRFSNKLAKHYSGPYKVEGRVGKWLTVWHYRRQVRYTRSFMCLFLRHSSLMALGSGGIP
ncbi:hypothetical protein Tco_0920869 [Tanacetum coccineum]